MGVSLKNWTKELYLESKTLTLGNIYIPGSHDSGAYKELIYHQNWARTQDLSIYDQLCTGIRYLDLRLALVSGEYYVAHTYLYIPFAVALDDINRFIGETDEFVILSITEDNANKTGLSSADFFGGVIGYLSGTTTKYMTTTNGASTLEEIYKQPIRILIPEKGLYNIWPNTMSESELLVSFMKSVTGTGRYGSELIPIFDYVYTINALYIASCYLYLVLPIGVISFIVSYYVNRKYYREMNQGLYITAAVIATLVLMFALSPIIPVISMPYLGGRAKNFIREHINTPDVFPHVVLYDYVTEDVNRMVIDKNFSKG